MPLNCATCWPIKNTYHVPEWHLQTNLLFIHSCFWIEKDISPDAAIVLNSLYNPVFTASFIRNKRMLKKFILNFHTVDHNGPSWLCRHVKNLNNKNGNMTVAKGVHFRLNLKHLFNEVTHKVFSKAWIHGSWFLASSELQNYNKIWIKGEIHPK